MAVSVYSSGGSGTYTSTGASTVTSISTSGTFTFHVDLNAMVAGDIVELRIYSKILSGSTARVVYYQQYRNAQSPDNAIQISVPISNDLTESGALTFQIYQNGTKSIPFKVLQYV